MRLDVTTRASPEQVRRALTDFSDRRLQIWSRTLDPKTYEVRELGDSWAVARESTQVEWTYTDIRSRRDEVLLFLIQRFPTSRMISRMWTSALDDYARSG